MQSLTKANVYRIIYPVALEHLTRKLLRFESNYTDFVPRLCFFSRCFHYYASHITNWYYNTTNQLWFRYFRKLTFQLIIVVVVAYLKSVEADTVLVPKLNLKGKLFTSWDIQILIDHIFEYVLDFFLRFKESLVSLQTYVYQMWIPFLLFKLFSK